MIVRYLTPFGNSLRDGVLNQSISFSRYNLCVNNPVSYFPSPDSENISIYKLCLLAIRYFEFKEKLEPIKRCSFTFSLFNFFIYSLFFYDVGRGGCLSMGKSDL